MGAVDAGVPLLCYREASAPAPPRERRLGAAGPCCMAHLAGVVFFGLVVSLRSLEQQVRLGQSHIGVRNRSDSGVCLGQACGSCCLETKVSQLVVGVRAGCGVLEERNQVQGILVPVGPLWLHSLGCIRSRGAGRQEGHVLDGHKDREPRRPEEPGACRDLASLPPCCVGKRKQKERAGHCRSGGFLRVWEEVAGGGRKSCSVPTTSAGFQALVPQLPPLLSHGKGT